MKGFVYLLCDGDKFKIGMTCQKDIHKRISELQTGNPNEIFLSSYYKTDYPYRIEQMMHLKFKSSNVMNEWFELTSDQVVHFKDLCIECENILNSLKENPFIKFC